MLAFASYADLKNREVSDYLWAIFGLIAVMLLILGIYDEKIIQNTVLSLIFCVPLSIIFWKKGLFGGADSFALILCGILSPFSFNGVYYPTTIITNSLILMFPIFLINLLGNVQRLFQKTDIFEGFNEIWYRKILAMLLGKQTKSKFGFPIEIKTINGKKFDFSLKNCETIEFNSKNEWCSIGFPFILFILGGFIVQMFYGDVFLSLFISHG